ncbi:MAG: hypothetical protein KY439_02980 [Actinobacteria bacterium]|nr:hypothetical protein [Actinomycetota bacterium]
MPHYPLDLSWGLCMRFFRPVSAAVATSVVAAAVFAGPATAQSPGVGTSLTETKVLAAQLGDKGSVLDVVLLGDQARSTIDPSVASPEAFTRLTALSTKSGVISALNQNVGVYEARSTGPTEQAVAPQTIVPASLPAALGPVLSGSLGSGKLSAVLDNGVASSALDAGVTNVRSVGGLLGIGSLSSNLTASSAGDAANAARGAKVSDITVLDLGALLEGLGISLADLSVSQVSALLDTLQATTGLDLPAGQTTLAGTVTALNAAIDDLQDAVATEATSTIGEAVEPTTNTLLGTVGLDTPLSDSAVVGDSVAAINAAVDQLQDQIDDLLGESLKALDDLALLRLEGVEVGVTTKAVDSVDASVAEVTGKIGKIKVGNITLPAIDAAATASAVNAAVAQINDKVSDTLSAVSPGLANLVDVSVLDKVTSVTQSGGYTRSRAGITGASAAITPPAALGDIVSTITNQAGGIDTLLPASTVKSLGLSGAMDELSRTLNLGAGVLSGPAKVQAGSIVASSEFARSGGAPTTPGDTLPRTGGPVGIAFIAGLAAAMGLVLRRWMQTPAPRTVRVDNK